MSFTDEEVAYLRSQPLARIATVAPDGQPDAAAVGFEYDGTYIYVGGMRLTSTRKFRNVRDGNDKVAIVVDDLAATDPWTPRFMRIYGTAELIERATESGTVPVMRVTPTISWSWNLDGRPFGDGKGPGGPRRTVHQPPASGR